MDKPLDNKMQRPDRGTAEHKLTDKERLDRQFGKHKPQRAADGLPKASRVAARSPHFGANYGPSASYTPATDDCGGYPVPDRSDGYPDP